MRKAICAVVTALALGNLSFADDAAFNVKLADAKGKQAEARLIFSDDAKHLAIHVADRDLVTVSYDQLDKFSYEYTKKHRVTAGAITMVASLGAGAIVMLTKSKSHWLYIVLRMDKSDYKKIFEAVKTHTGKDVEMLGDANDKSKKDQKKEASQDKDKPASNPQ